ncbi:MAG: hypothetical protein O7H41_13685 [Planctomycetota bacterium]|nr:hypothetical protein [Planctomycetota bacterium]
MRSSVIIPAWPALITALVLLPSSAAGQEGMYGLYETGRRPSLPTFPLYDIPVGSQDLPEPPWRASPHGPRRDIHDPSHQELARETPWLFGEIAVGFHSSGPRGKAIDAGGGETFSYRDVWRGGFGGRLQLRLHYGIAHGEKTGLTIGPGLFIENGGYGNEGGTQRITLRDGTELDPETLRISRVLAIVHGRYLFPHGFFAGTQVGVGLGFTNEVGIDVTDPGGVETKMILFRRTQMITYDLSLRVGWTWTGSQYGVGFYFEAGLGYVGAPRIGNYSGADPDRILIGYGGFALVFSGEWSARPPVSF